MNGTGRPLVYVLGGNILATALPYLAPQSIMGPPCPRGNFVGLWQNSITILTSTTKYCVVLFVRPGQN